MRRIESDQFFALAGTSAPTFRATVNRCDAAMAFGVGHKLAGGTFLDLDVISWRLTDELTPAFGRYLAANLVRGFSDVWCGAVADADSISAPIFIVVIE